MSVFKPLDLESEQPIAGPSSIPLYLINGVATVWDAQTAATLHCQYEIAGLRVGTLPGVSQQNGFLGLPVTLMQEETAYLVQQGIAHLIPVRPDPALPPASVVQAQKTERVRRIRALEQASQEAAQRAQEEGRRKFAQAGEKAKQKRADRAAAKRAAGADAVGGGAGAAEGAAAGAGELEMMIPEPQPSKPTPTPTPVSGAQGYFHTVPSHPLPLLSGEAEARENERAEERITTIPHPLFPFPLTARHRALVRTFSDLLARGYRMGLGPRFGGEYLIYPGDYLRYHAHFTSQVLVNDEPVKPAELVAWGRLGTGTKKAGLICCVDPEAEPEPERSEGEGTGESGSGAPGQGQGAGQEGKVAAPGGVSYYSLEWANFG